MPNRPPLRESISDLLQERALSQHLGPSHFARYTSLYTASRITVTVCYVSRNPLLHVGSRHPSVCCAASCVAFQLDLDFKTITTLPTLSGPVTAAGRAFAS